MNNEINQRFIDNFLEAEKLYKDKRFNESLEIYKALLEDQPNHISVLINIGLVYENLGELNKTIEFYKKCCELKPHQALQVHNLANIYSRLERWTDAFPLLKKLINIDFNNENNTEKYALCLFNIKSKEETKCFINSAISKYPDNQLLNRLLGKSLLHLNSHKDGLKYLQKASGFIEFSTDGIKYLE